MSAFPETKLVRLERLGPHLRVILDDPTTQNALSEGMVGELDAVLAGSVEDGSLRSLVIEGANGMFCAGADLKSALAELDRQPAQGELDPLFLRNRRGGEFFARLDAHPLVTIAVVDGPAFGGGFGLACCADIVIATARARFALSETSLGIPPAQIAPFLVARLGARLARRLALTGTRLDGKGARDIGLVDFFCETEDELEHTLKQLLNEIGRCAPGANAVTKRLIQSCAGSQSDDFLDEAAQAFSSSLRGREGREGVAAFLAKRPARWVEKI
ncbi:isohexenylglutaconyl-CoA hydratase [Rhizobiales bacterium GAS113]|nr:isohexenylglutaconyl-CoA hydratase [Rhizobiales bacterium GAS113]SEE54080.1 isohexenylglutaconyl-CoA hydratase [Rhizobiales bacterium GAS188]